MVDVLGLGHCCLDYLCILDPYPDKGKKGDVVQSKVVGGGPVPTALATLTKFGKSTRFCGIVGDDSAGRQIIDSLEQEGVVTDSVNIIDNMKTPRAFIWIDPVDGSRTIALDRTGMPPIPGIQMQREQIESCRLFLSDGRFIEPNLTGLKWAREMGVTTVLDTGAVRSRFDQILPLIDFAVVSADLADTYAPGAGPEELAQRLMDGGVKTAVVTIGEEGAIWMDGNRKGNLPGFAIEAYDTTGAGDVFHGGFIFGLLEGWELEKTIRFANAAAALSTQKLSGRGGIPEIDQVRDLLRL